jgi:hypothetical protein
MDAAEISTNSVKGNGSEAVFRTGIRIIANGFLAATDGVVTSSTGVKFTAILALHWHPVEYCVKTWMKCNPMATHISCSSQPIFGGLFVERRLSG